MIAAGCCYIVDVRDGWGPPVVGILVTDLAEKYPIYSDIVRAEAEIAACNRLPVYLDIVPRYEAEKRYVKAIHTLRREDRERLCVSCGQQSVLMPSDGPASVPFYECASCHFRAYLGRVPAVTP